MAKSVNIDTSNTRIHNSFLKISIIGLLIVLIISSIALYWHFQQNKQQLLETIALESAQAQSEMLNRFRTAYSSLVVQKASKFGMVATHDYEGKENAIPLPATFTLEMANDGDENDPNNIQYKLYSDYPFPWRSDSGGLQDVFAKEAWNTLTVHPDEFFYRVETINGQNTLRYATADRMRESCVSCHNRHLDTPKNNWKEGDVRGILEVNIPMGRMTAKAAIVMQNTLIELLIVISLGLLIVTFLFFQLHKQSMVTVQFSESLHEKNIELEQEITERLEAEGRLSEIMGRQEAIMKASVDPMATIEFNGIVLTVSDSFEKEIGWSRDEIVGQNISSIIPEPHRSNHDTYLKNYRETGKTNILYLTREFSVIRKDGTEFPCELTVSRVDVPGQDHTFFTGIIRDISKRRLAEEENSRLEDQLRQSQKMEAIGTLAGGIAHDFNNLLTAIKGFTELAQSDASENKMQYENLDEVLIASDRATELVQQILTFSRKSEEEMHVVDFKKVLNETLKLLRPSLPSTITLQCSLPESTMHVMADPTKIHQIIVNLCTNAAGAMKNTNGLINLVLQEITILPNETNRINIIPGVYCQLNVTDTGCGIPLENMERIFDPFFTTKEVGEGTGMGLAVVHSIVKNYGGVVTIDSEVEKGTTFSVFLPKSTAKTADHIKSIPLSITGNERILLVDDEDMVVRLNNKILSSKGYDVVVSQDGANALNLYRNDPIGFHLVITDQTMPKMRGDELATAILAINPDARIILCSGYSDTMDTIEAQKLGIKQFLNKPVPTNFLLQTIRHVLDEE